MKRSVAVGALLGGLFALAPVAAGLRLVPPHLMVTPSELNWTDAEALPPGAKLAVIQGPLNASLPYTFRLKFPPDYKIPAHRHPAIEHVTVLSGTLNMGTGERLDTTNTTALPAGSVAIMQPRVPHFAWTEEETIIQAHGVGPWAINYVNPRDDPRRKKQ